MNAQHINFLAGGNPSHSLSEFAKSVYAEFRISDFEVRESSNYVDGFYFTAVSGSRIFKVMLSNSETHLDLPYWLRVSRIDGSEPFSTGEIDAIGKQLVQNGYKVARIVNPGQKDELRFDYA
jgi:hypothetical protein